MANWAKKKCSKCKTLRPVSWFRRRLNGCGRRSQCRVCERKRVVRWRHRHPVKFAESRKRRQVLRQYGLSMAEYNRLIQQNPNCQICGCALKMPCIDHCHQTKKIRGVLCKKCNVGLGCFNDDRTLLKKAMKYLRGQANG